MNDTYIVTAFVVIDDLLPASAHDLTPLHELVFVLPAGARLFGDKGSLSQADAHTLLLDTGVRLVTPQRRHMTPTRGPMTMIWLCIANGLRWSTSQLEAMGPQRLHARTNPGLELKAWASLRALAFTNIVF